MRDGIVDLAAYGGKMAVDYSSMKPESKELSKVSIDLGKEGLKLFIDWLETQKKDDSSVCCNQSDFQKVAKDCGLQRITFAWIFFGDTGFPCYYMEGGNIAKFCKMLGIVQFPETMSSEYTNEIIDRIRKYGTVIYCSEE